MRGQMIAIIATVFGLSSASSAPPVAPRLQIVLESESFTPGYVEVLQRRMETFAKFRNKGESQVYPAAKGSPDVVVELPITRSEARRIDELQQTVLELLTRPGGIEFVWDVGSKSHDALLKLQKAIGAGWVDETVSPHLRVPAEVSVDAIEKALSTVSPAPGSRWVIEELPPESKTVGSTPVVFAAMKVPVLDDHAVESTYLLKG